VTVPDPATLTAAVRASRELPNCKITASFRGFIHEILIPIYLSF
jgi:hypothetical protein